MTCDGTFLPLQEAIQHGLGFLLISRLHTVAKSQHADMQLRTFGIVVPLKMSQAELVTRTILPDAVLPAA